MSPRYSPDESFERTKFRILWNGSIDTCSKPLHSFAAKIYELARQKPGGQSYWSTRPHDALQVQLALRRPLSPVLSSAICEFFGISLDTWNIQNKIQFTESAWSELAKKGKLVAPLVWQSISAMSAFGHEISLSIRPAEQPMLGLVEDSPDVPTFAPRHFVKVALVVRFPARVLLLHVSPHKRISLLVPSVFAPESNVRTGVTDFPTHAPRVDHPQAFAVHEPMGVHYLWALAVHAGANIKLLKPSDSMRPREVDAGELDRIGTELSTSAGGLPYGVGILMYQVVPARHS